MAKGIGRTQVTVPLALIDNVRTGYIRRDVLEDETTLDTMVKSIREVGLILPLLIMPDYQLVDGSIRLEALRRLGWNAIPIVFANDWEVTQSYFAEVRRVAAEGMAPKPMWWLDLRDLVEMRFKLIYQPISFARRSQAARGRVKGHSTVATNRARYSPMYDELDPMLGISVRKLVVIRDIGSSLVRTAKTISVDVSKQLRTQIDQIQENGGGIHTALEMARSTARIGSIESIESIGSIAPNRPPRRISVAAARDQTGDIERLIVVLGTLSQQASRLLPLQPAIDPEVAERQARTMRTAMKKIALLSTALKDHADNSQGESE